MNRQVRVLFMFLSLVFLSSSANADIVAAAEAGNLQSVEAHIRQVESKININDTDLKSLRDAALYASGQDAGRISVAIIQCLERLRVRLGIETYSSFDESSWELFGSYELNDELRRIREARAQAEAKAVVRSVLAALIMLSLKSIP
jgi:hypothetical protein